MATNFEDVGEFRTKFGFDSIYARGAGPRDRTDEELEIRRKHMQEELDEFVEGCQEGNDAKIADALIDLVYVAMGTAHLMGFPWQVLWDEVQRANMSKRRVVSASESKRGDPTDVVKPDGWRPPNIEGILLSYGWREDKVES